MKDLKFNIYAFVRPETPEERSALLDEALRIAEELDEAIKVIGKLLEEQRGRP